MLCLDQIRTSDKAFYYGYVEVECAVIIIIGMDVYLLNGVFLSCWQYVLVDSKINMSLRERTERRCSTTPLTMHKNELRIEKVRKPFFEPV